MRRRIRPRYRAGLAALFVVAAAMVFGSGAASATPVTGAAFTTVNENVDDTGHCLNGNPAVNCNIYTGKQYVWLNGGPSTASVGDGTYFFAVLDPGSQNAGPNDDSDGNLSSPNDTYQNRTFTVSSGVVSYAGNTPTETPHDFSDNKIRLMPYDDTSNPGGVYILAICAYDAATYDPVINPVDPSTCKYDAFKVMPSRTVFTASGPTVSKDAAGAYNTKWTWGIEKLVDKTEVDTSSTGAVTFNYTVNVTHGSGTNSGVTVSGTIDAFNGNLDVNKNVVPVTGVTITDILSDGTKCTVNDGSNVDLTTTDTLFPYSCSLGALPSGELTNNVTATWGDQDLNLSGDPTFLTHLAAGSHSFAFPSIRFTQTKIDDSVTVTDTLGGTLGTVSSTDPSPKTFQYSHDVTGTPGTCVPQDNTATFTTDTTKTTGSDSQSVKVCVGKDLTVSKTATPAFQRKYYWKIEKSVDKPVVEPGGTVNYTVTATETGFTDSGWKVSGTITVHNPNDFEPVTLTGVSDSTPGGTCVVSGSKTQTIAAGGDSTGLTYTCTFSSNPRSGTNTATATWGATAAYTLHETASGTWDYLFGDPTSTVNKTINVTDSFAGALGTATATDATPFTVATFTYTRQLSPPSSGCVFVNNTATIVETSQTASASVKDCNTGALTMGFWQNKNGQAIITKANQSNLGAWLRGYHPFSDAPSSGLAAYVYNIIKVATCSGPTSSPCNKMLRAQMLATALDVYFSDPALGGNMISAPAPIGGVSIDLTKICKMIDGSGGTATCSSSYQNVSVEFGGATSMTVSAMLAYQNTSDPAVDAGAVWYGNNKSMQVPAKDAFDAINNQVAVSP